MFDVEDGVVKSGTVFSDSLNPDFITAIDRILKEGRMTYDFDGVRKLKEGLEREFGDEETRGQIGEMCEWLKEAI